MSFRTAGIKANVFWAFDLCAYEAENNSGKSPFPSQWSQNFPKTAAKTWFGTVTVPKTDVGKALTKLVKYMLRL